MKINCSLINMTLVQRIQHIIWLCLVLLDLIIILLYVILMFYSVITVLITYIIKYNTVAVCVLTVTYFLFQVFADVKAVLDREGWIFTAANIHLPFSFSFYQLHYIAFICTFTWLFTFFSSMSFVNTVCVSPICRSVNEKYVTRLLLAN